MMQTPKARSVSTKASPRSGSSEVSSPKDSPQPRVVRKLKTSPRYSEHTASSSNLATRPPKERSPKVADHRSPRSPASSEKKRPGKVTELESQITQLENDLKTVKDQLISTEAVKKKAEKEAKESNEKLAALSLKLEESQKQLSDRTLQSGIVTGDNEQSLDSAELASALDEIERLKSQLDKVPGESDASHSKKPELEEAEISKLKESLSDAHLLVEEMKDQLKESKESETRAQEFVGETLVQLETAKKAVDSLKLDGLKANEAYNAVAVELEQSRARVSFLEELVSKLKADISKGHGDTIETKEITSAKDEVEQLKSDLAAAELRCKEESEESAVKIRNAVEMAEMIKSETSQREEELESEVRKCKYEIEELKANLMDKETELQGICEENEGLIMKLDGTLSGQRETELEKELNKSKADIESMKSSLSDKEKMWRNLSEENEKLKQEMKELKNGFGRDETVLEIETATAAEKEAVMKAGYMAEELDKSNRKVARVVEQLEAAQAANAGMEAELRRLKVQSDQWRKAAEAAAAMLNNGQLMERTGSMDSHYSPRSGKINSPYGDDLDDEMLKKKNANMLRRIGVLWKKPQK